MDEKELQAMSDLIVEKMLAPHNLDMIATAIARELRRVSTSYGLDLNRLGAMLDAGHY